MLAPVDNSSIVAFRIAFGLIMIWEMNRYITNGWIDSIYLDPQYLFTYQYFDWVKPWPGNWLHLHFYVLAIFALMMALGLWYRVSTVLFFVGFSYVFLLDKGNYLNHLYLSVLISFLMIFVPAHRSLSIDVWRNPRLKSNTAPTWALVLLAVQFAVVYVFGAIAKLNEDWLHAHPMDIWLPNASDFPVIGRWFSERWMAYAFSYGGLLIDLLIVPLMLWRRTRWFAVIILIVFHRFNAEIFSIGIFPTFATAAIVLFLPPDLPRRVVNAIRPAPKRGPQRVRAAASVDSGNVGASTPFLQRPLVQRVTVGLVLGYIAIQLLVPWRYLFYPGNPGWTDQGDRFAWRMMLHSKYGDIDYEVRDPVSGQTWDVSPDDYLSSAQRNFLVGQPDMILQFSHFLADEWAKQGYPDVEVRANTMVSFNSRPPVPIVDPTVDLASEELSIGHADWITSIDEQQELLKSGDSEQAGD